jgi:IS4 transposase
VDALFEQVAERQYTRTLVFSTVVDLMSTVVCRIRPSIHAAYQAKAEAVEASLRAVYDKLDRVETAVSAALVRHSAQTLAPVIDALPDEPPAWLPGYRVKILDGSHLPGTEHRLKPLRTTRAGALPGQALVVLDPQRMLVSETILCEDGHAQERSRTEAIVALVQPGEVWLADRNFCTTALLFGVAQRGGAFVIRQHASTLTVVARSEPVERGRCTTGEVTERTLELSHPDGRRLAVRRVTVTLDQPTRDGDTEIHLLTNLPEAVADAQAIAELYRRRWTLETAFQELEATLHGEIDTLGYPKAALFAFCLALVAYNVLAVVKATLRSVHGAKAGGEAVSAYYLADEIAGTYRGLVIALPDAAWSAFQDLPVAEFAYVLRDWAGKVRLSAFTKHPRGPKKLRPPQTSGAQVKHVATARLLKGQTHGTS